MSVAQTKSRQPRRPTASLQSGGHGTLPKPFSDLQSAQQLRRQVYLVQHVAQLWLLFVVCCCLWSFGIGLSTLSAHSSEPVGDPAGDETATPALRRPRRRRSHAPVDTSGEDEVIAASYSRYSSEGQREESIADQQRKCREAAEANGHRLLPEFEYADEAVSGTKLCREGLDAMLRDAEDGAFQVLYFHSLSRLARESVITMTMLKQLVHRHGVRVISTSEGNRLISRWLGDYLRHHEHSARALC